MLKISGGEPMPQHEIIPTPSFGLNYVLGGGLWTGRFHMLWGNSQSGKTTFYFHVMREAEAMGYRPLIIDTERSYTDEWAIKQCGLSLDREVVQTNELSDIEKVAVEAMQDKNQKWAILIDSINAIEDEAFYKKADSGGGMASGARARRELLTKLINYTHPQNNVVFLVCQQTMDLSGTYPVTTAKIGNAERHYCTNIIRLFASSAKDNIVREDDGMISDKSIRWTVDKSKQGPVEGTYGNYHFSPQTAHFGKTKELIDLGVKCGLITRRGPYYYYGFDGEYKFQGIQNLENGLEKDGLVDILESQLSNTHLTFESDHVNNGITQEL